VHIIPLKNAFSGNAPRHHEKEARNALVGALLPAERMPPIAAELQLTDRGVKNLALKLGMRFQKLFDIAVSPAPAATATTSCEARGALRGCVIQHVRFRMVQFEWKGLGVAPVPVRRGAWAWRTTLAADFAAQGLV
jgi:hypothetical protein